MRKTRPAPWQREDSGREIGDREIGKRIALATKTRSDFREEKSVRALIYRGRRYSLTGVIHMHGAQLGQ